MATGDWVASSVEQLLVHLEVAAVDAVVVGDHDLGELGVLVLDRLDRAAEGLGDHVEPPERALLERREVLLIIDADFHRHYPTFPVT